MVDCVSCYLPLPFLSTVISRSYLLMYYFENAYYSKFIVKKTNVIFVMVEKIS